VVIYIYDLRSACSREGMVVFVVMYCRREDWYMVRLGYGNEEKDLVLFAFKMRLIRT